MKIPSVVESSNKGLIYSKLADGIKNYIDENNLKIGDKLPSERYLSSQLGISRNSVREALRQLENQGIISVRTGIGSFVEKVGLEDSVTMQFVKVNFVETLEIKANLELLSISKAIKSATDEQLDELEQLVLEMIEISNNGDYPQELDNKLHKTILEYSDNSTLIMMINQMIDVLNSYWKKVSMDYEKLKTTIPPHYEMIKCMKARDYEGAKVHYGKICQIDIEILQSSKG